MQLLTLPTSNPDTVRRFTSAFPHVAVVDAKGLDDIRTAYEQGEGLIGVCAAGILIRAVAGVLHCKHKDAPLLALADDGSCIIPLLGGHHGANAWARDVADKLGQSDAQTHSPCFAAITTASDLRLGFDFEAPPASLALASDHKDFVARALKGENIAVQIDEDMVLDEEATAFLQAVPNQVPHADLVLHVAYLPKNDGITYVPRTTFIGVGASRNCPPTELAKLAAQCLVMAGRHPASVVAVASHEIKADEPAVLNLATAFDAKSEFFDSATLNQHKSKLSRTSEIVFRETGCWGVAEAAALQAASTDTLLLPKQKSAQKIAMATCALAELDTRKRK